MTTPDFVTDAGLGLSDGPHDNLAGPSSILVVPSKLAEPTAPLASLHAALQQAASDETDLDGYQARLGHALQSASGAHWVAIVAVNAADDDDALVLLGQADAWPTVQEAVCKAVQQASAANDVTIGKLSSSPDQQIVAIPLPDGQRCLVAFCRPPVDHRPINALLLVVPHVAFWLSRRDQHQHLATLHQVAAISELTSRVATAQNLQGGCQVLADELQGLVGCHEVAIGVLRSDRAACQLVSVSRRPHLDGSSEFGQMLAAALHESATRGQQATWPANDELNRHALCSLRQLSQETKQGIVAGPLCDVDGHCRGAYVALGDAATLHDHRTLTLLSAVEEPAAAALSLMQRAERSWVVRLANNSMSRLRKQRTRTVFGCCAVIIFCLLIPVRYRVKCDCELQPVVRRYIAAPLDGRLERAHVEPGDLVELNQLLAELDPSDVQWELSGKRAELNRVRKELAGHRATHDSGQAVISELEVERLRLRIAQLDEQAQHLDVRSPVQGMVLTGDLSKAEGAPLELGQALFEIAPLEQMVIELSVPEDDVRFVRTDMPVQIRLDAFPMQRFAGTVDHLHPRAELQDEDNVFVAEVNIHNPDGLLRPGMRGKAKIVTVKRPIAWNLFHRAFAAGLAWLGW